MATSPAPRRHSRRYLALSAATVLTAAFALPALAAGPAVPAPKAAAKTTKKSAPKAGGTCAKSQLNARSGSLVCKKSGSSYKWFTVASSSSGSTSAPTDTAATSDVNPSQIDLIALVNGNGPASYSIKLDVKCNGLAQTPKDASASVSFGAQGGSNQVTFKLSPPNVDNPTGSTCSITSTSTGGSPTVRLLVNGRPATNPSNAATSTTPDFTAEGPYTVTALVDFGGSAPAAATTTAPAAATTTVAGATTTTIAPPTSGKPEVGARWIGTPPAGVTGIDILTTCTSATPGGAFQTQLQRIGTSDASVPLALTMAPPSGSFAGTSCQITGTLVGPVSASATLRVFVRGNVVSGPSIGSLINSPAFAAPSAWQGTVEISTGSATSSTTTTTSAVTTTTVPTRATLTLTKVGSAPVGVTGYGVEVQCTNVWVNGTANVFANWTATYPAAGGSAEVPFAFGSNSACSFKVTTVGGSTGNIGVTVNGTSVGTGVNGAALTSSVPTPTAFTAGVTVAY